MKKVLIKILFLIGFSTLFLGVYYSDFNIVSDADNVVLSWHTAIEENLKEHQLKEKLLMVLLIQ